MKNDNFSELDERQKKLQILSSNQELTTKFYLKLPDILPGEAAPTENQIKASVVGAIQANNGVGYQSAPAGTVPKSPAGTIPKLGS